MTAASNDPSDIAFDKMMTAAFETCDALTDFYCHMEDVRRNALAGVSTPEDKAQALVGIVHEAHDRYFAAACEFQDLPCTCANCRAEEEAAKTAAPTPSAAPTPPPVKPAPASRRGFH